MLRLIGYYLSNNKSSRESFLRNYQYLHQVIPTWLELKDDGSLLRKDTKAERQFLEERKEIGEIIPLVQNYHLSSAVSNRIVAAVDKWEKVAEELIEYLQENGYQAVNLDLEGIKGDKKELFNNFICFIADILRQENYRLSLSIPAKTENHSDAAWVGAYDYNKLGQEADEIIIMAYDYHWSGGPPGPIAPLGWVQDVIDYAIMEMPSTKIYLGVPCYGYDWNLDHKDQSARGLSFYQIEKIQQKYRVESEWDQESQTPYLTYNAEDGKHEIWFENKVSIGKKIKLVEEFQLAGTAFWRLGLEDPELWRDLAEVIG